MQAQYAHVTVTTRNRGVSSGAQFSRTPPWRASGALCGPDPVRWALGDLRHTCRELARALAARLGSEHSLLAAILLDRKEQVAEHLAKGADLAARDGLGRTVLMAASDHGFAGIVTALLAAGAKPEFADKRGRTALPR